MPENALQPLYLIAIEPQDIHDQHLVLTQQVKSGRSWLAATGKLPEFVRPRS